MLRSDGSDEVFQVIRYDGMFIEDWVRLIASDYYSLVWEENWTAFYTAHLALGDSPFPPHPRRRVVLVMHFEV